MEKRSLEITDNQEGFVQEKSDYSKYEISFRRWLVREIDSGQMSLLEAKERFKLPYHFSKVYKRWQKKHSETYHVSLSLMTAKERTENAKLELRIKELEKKLERAKMKNLAVETMIDIAETEFKIDIRKKFGSKQ
jgi:hypothetical protein